MGCYHAHDGAAGAAPSRTHHAETRAHQCGDRRARTGRADLRASTPVALRGGGIRTYTEVLGANIVPVVAVDQAGNASAPSNAEAVTINWAPGGCGV